MNLKYQDEQCYDGCVTGYYILQLRMLQSKLWSLTRITCHNLGDLCPESAELLLQGGSAVQCSHTGLLKPFHPFAFTAKVGNGRVPVEHQERRGPPFVL